MTMLVDTGAAGGRVLHAVLYGDGCRAALIGTVSGLFSLHLRRGLALPYLSGLWIES